MGKPSTPPFPTEGGSYTRKHGGKLDRVAATTPPPAVHETTAREGKADENPPAPTPAIKES